MKTEPKKLECWKDEFRHQFINDHNGEWRPLRGLYMEDVFDFIQSLIQSTKEEMVGKIMGLECMKEQKIIKHKLPYFELMLNNEIIIRNQLRNQIKEQINSLLKE